MMKFILDKYQQKLQKDIGNENGQLKIFWKVCSFGLTVSIKCVTF